MGFAAYRRCQGNTSYVRILVIKDESFQAIYYGGV